jgi:undecaprenyl-diphosphatase
VDVLKVICLALLEGITEFLPISSTGHLILVEDYLNLGDDPAFAKAFMVLIQLPAILSVVVYFWKDLWPFQDQAQTGPTLTLWSKILVAFIPAMVLGYLFGDYIEQYLFKPIIVAAALIMGGVILLAVERLKQRQTFATVGEITYEIAFLIGCFQCVAMIPGTSRSAATIIGAMILGASRPAAAEFSFFLAIPTMCAASAYTLLKGGIDFTAHQWGLIALGSLVSFFVAYGVIAFLMNFIRKHSFTVFGYYRIVLGLLVLALLYRQLGLS